MQSRETQQQRIPGEHCKVREPSPTRDQQADDRQHESHGAVVAALAERVAKPPGEVDRDEVAAEQLHSAVRRDPFV
jgi:hypothetical protein